MPTAGIGEAAGVGEDRQAVQVGGLALIGRHAERRVALEVLDEFKAFLAGEADIRRSHVVLQVDESLSFGGDLEEGVDIVGSPAATQGRRGLSCLPRLGLEAERTSSILAGRGAFFRGFGRGESALHGARRRPGLTRLSGQKGGQRLVIDRRAAGLAGEMDERVPAGGDEQRVAGELARGARDMAGGGVENLDPERFQRLAAARGSDDLTGEELGPGSRRGRRRRGLASRSGGSTTARTGTPARDSAAARRQPLVIVGEDHDLAADRDAVAARISKSRRRPA